LRIEAQLVVSSGVFKIFEGGKGRGAEGLNAGEGFPLPLGVGSAARKFFNFSE